MNRQFGAGATTVYAGLSSLDYRVAAGSIGPQGTIPHAAVNAYQQPVLNVPTTGLPAQPTPSGQPVQGSANPIFGGIFTTRFWNPPSGAGSTGPGSVILPPTRGQTPIGLRPTGGPVQAGSGGIGPVAVGGPVRPPNSIGHLTY